MSKLSEGIPRLTHWARVALAYRLGCRSLPYLMPLPQTSGGRRLSQSILRAHLLAEEAIESASLTSAIQEGDRAHYSGDLVTAEGIVSAVEQDVSLLLHENRPNPERLEAVAEVVLNALRAAARGDAKWTRDAVKQMLHAAKSEDEMELDITDIGPTKGTLHLRGPFTLMPFLEGSWRDLDSLLEASKREGWTDETPISLECFSPLWDQEVPPPPAWVGLHNQLCRYTQPEEEGAG